VDWFVGWFDWIAILSGVFALLFIFLIPIEKEQSWVDNWVFVNGAICVLYLLYAIGLLLFNTAHGIIIIVISNKRSVPYVG
jgi:glucan phosphoethanolaminetransferase (alkaline phosphatase superfamily)